MGSCWSCNGNEPDGVTVPAAGDDAVVRMSNSACDWNLLDGARLIVSSVTPLLNSFTVETPYECKASSPCNTCNASWQQYQYACPCAASCSSNVPDKGSQRPCVGSVVVNAGAKLKATTIAFGFDTRLNLNGGTLEAVTFTSFGWIAGTGTIKATSAALIDNGDLLPGWFARATLVELGSFRSCSVQWPRWAPNGTVSMFGDLLFDTPILTLNETRVYFKDLVYMSEFPGRAHAGVPHDTLTVTGSLQYRALQTLLLRSNNSYGAVAGAVPFLSVLPEAPFLWNLNSTLMYYSSIVNLDPTNWPGIFVSHLADGTPLIPLASWVWRSRTSPNSVCNQLQIFDCPSIFKKKKRAPPRKAASRFVPSCHCQDTSACGAYSQTAFSILLAPAGSCPNQFNPQLQPEILPTTAAASSTSGSPSSVSSSTTPTTINTTTATQQTMWIVILVVVVSVVGAAVVIAVVGVLLFRWKHVQAMRSLKVKIQAVDMTD
jgi:hypothetical protein